MRQGFLYLCLAVGCLVAGIQGRLINDRGLLEQLRENAPWQAAESRRFAGWTVENMESRLSLLLKEDTVERNDVWAAEDIPDSFDSRQQWGNCTPAILDQQECGASYAFGGSTLVLQWRMCIAGGDNVDLSQQFVITCDTNEDGCYGGSIQDAWAFLEQTGTVTETCFPYGAGFNFSYYSSTSACPSGTCPGGGSWETYTALSGSSAPLSSVSAIQTSIMTYGPVSSGLKVYTDFLLYHSGVYQHTEGPFVGGQAVMLIGWDTVDDKPVWIAANSWGEEWGMQGYFYISRGDDECGIESNAYAGLFSNSTHNTTTSTSSSSSSSTTASGTGSSTTTGASTTGASTSASTTASSRTSAPSTSTTASSTTADNSSATTDSHSSSTAALTTTAASGTTTTAGGTTGTTTTRHGSSSALSSASRSSARHTSTSGSTGSSTGGTSSASTSTTTGTTRTSRRTKTTHSTRWN